MDKRRATQLAHVKSLQNSLRKDTKLSMQIRFSSLKLGVKCSQNKCRAVTLLLLIPVRVKMPHFGDLY